MSPNPKTSPSPAKMSEKSAQMGGSNPPAAALVHRLLGREVPITSGWRSRAEQQLRHRGIVHAYGPM